MSNERIVTYMPREIMDLLDDVQSDTKVFPERPNRTMLLRFLLRRGLASVGPEVVSREDSCGQQAAA